MKVIKNLVLLLVLLQIGLATQSACAAPVSLKEVMAILGQTFRVTTKPHVENVGNVQYFQSPFYLIRLENGLRLSLKEEASTRQFVNETHLYSGTKIRIGFAFSFSDEETRKFDSKDVDAAIQRFMESARNFKMLNPSSALTVNESTIYYNNLITVDADKFDVASLERLVRQLSKDSNARERSGNLCRSLFGSN